jgi:multidrug resistance efflux pump
MNATKNTCAVFVLLCLGLITARAAQENAEVQPGGDLQAKVVELERRVARLERLLDISSMLAPKTVRQAEQDLLLAEQRLEYCQRVGRKGYITPTRLASCELDVQKARQQLALAKGDVAPDTAAVEMAVLEAQFRVTDAEEKLRASEKMATQVQVNAARLAAERAAVELRYARTNKARHDKPRSENP